MANAFDNSPKKDDNKIIRLPRKRYETEQQDWQYYSLDQLVEVLITKIFGHSLFQSSLMGISLRNSMLILGLTFSVICGCYEVFSPNSLLRTISVTTEQPLKERHFEKSDFPKPISTNPIIEPKLIKIIWPKGIKARLNSEIDDKTYLGRIPFGTIKEVDQILNPDGKKITHRWFKIKIFPHELKIDAKSLYKITEPMDVYIYDGKEIGYLDYIK